MRSSRARPRCAPLVLRERSSVDRRLGLTQTARPDDSGRSLNRPPVSAATKSRMRSATLASGPARSCADAVPGTPGCGRVGSNGLVSSNRSPSRSRRSGSVRPLQRRQHDRLLFRHVLCRPRAPARRSFALCAGSSAERPSSSDSSRLISWCSSMEWSARAVALLGRAADRRIDQDLLGCGVLRQRHPDPVDDVLALSCRSGPVGVEQPLDLAVVVLDDGRDVGHAAAVPAATGF
jgi:hypothetical protein